MGDAPKLVNKHISLDLPPDPSYADQFFLAAGRVMVFWGRFESQLDWGLRMLMDHPASEPIRPKIKTGETIHRAFSKRIELWGEAFKKMPCVAPMREAAIKVRDRAKHLVKGRDAIAHAQWGGFIENGAPRLLGYQFEHKGPKLLCYEHKVPLSGFTDLAAAINQLRDQMKPLLHQLAKIPEIARGHKVGK